MKTAEVHELDKLLAGEIFTSTDIQTNLEILCDDLGSRFAGTPAEEEAAKFLHAKLEQYRLEAVHRESFEYHGWTRGAARLTVTSPWQRDLPCLSLPMSPAGQARGRIIDLGTGSPEVFEQRKAELEGNIAMVSIANPPFADRWVHRTEKYNRSILAGAKAFVFMSNQAGYGPITGALGFNQWGLIPGIMISKETGTQLQRLTRRKGLVEAEVETTDTISRKTSWNIIGDARGRGVDDEMVVIGVHYDGHDIGQGAEDPASGSVAGLEVARVMRLCSDRLRRKIRFVLFGVEELGLIGAHAYVDSHPDDIEKTRFMFNLDGSGSRQRKGLIVDRADTCDYFRKMGKMMNEDLVVDLDASALREPEHLSSDHYPFVARGIATGYIGDPYERFSSGFYHTAHDTVDKVDILNVRQAAFLCARLAWRIANDDQWPFERRSEETLARRQAVYDQCEVRQAEKAIDELRARLTGQLGR